MNQDSFGIAVGGERRLREAIEAQIRGDHHVELAAAADEPQKAAIEEKIQREIEEQMKHVASPYSLWSAQRL